MSNLFSFLQRRQSQSKRQRNRSDSRSPRRRSSTSRSAGSPKRVKRTRSRTPLKIPTRPVIDVKTLSMPDYTAKVALKNDGKTADPFALLNSFQMLRNAEDSKKKKDNLEVRFERNLILVYFFVLINIQYFLGSRTATLGKVEATDTARTASA